LKPRRVRFTETANHHVDRERAWWLENRDHQNLFATELEKAIEILALLPGAGTPYTQTSVPDLRRLYIRKLGCHLYYTFDADDVIVRALWGARRERGPML
jgi:plasmid stabilization system protein ParE